MTNKNDQVVAQLRAQFELQKFYRKEKIAIACLQGLLADTQFEEAPKDAAVKAIQYADALIKELGDPFP